MREGLAVAPEQRHQRGAGIERDLQIGLPQFVVDQFREIALGVRIAADRDRRLGALASFSQRRFRAKVPGLDDDAAILERHVGKRVDAACEAA